MNPYKGYGSHTSSNSDIYIANDKPKRGKKGKTLKCWQSNGFNNR